MLIGIGEMGATFIANQGVQTTNEAGQFEKIQIRATGKLGQIRNYPSIQTTTTFLENPLKWTGEKIATPEFAG